MSDSQGCLNFAVSTCYYFVTDEPTLLYEGECVVGRLCRRQQKCIYRIRLPQTRCPNHCKKTRTIYRGVEIGSKIAIGANVKPLALVNAAGECSGGMNASIRHDEVQVGLHSTNLETSNQFDLNVQ